MDRQRKYSFEKGDIVLLDENTIDKLRLVIDNCINNKIRHDTAKKNQWYSS